MAIRTLNDSAWEDIPDLKVPVNGAYETAGCANALVDGAWEEVWSNGYKVTTDSGGFSDTMYGISASEDEIRMGFKLGSSETLETNREVRIIVHGNFVNPVISCDMTQTCETTYMSDNTLTQVQLHQDGSLVGAKSVVGWENTSTVLTGSLSDYTLKGTGDAIVIHTRIYVAMSSFRNRTVKLVVKNLTIDGKKIAGDLVVGSSTYYS